jgi:exodeoxyribonuclease-3
MLVATWNVNSILARLPNVVRWLDKVGPDVLCMQETKCTDDKFPLDVFQERGYQCTIFGQQSYNGVAILSRGPCEIAQRGYPDDDDTAQSRLLSTTINGIRIVNVYIPNGQMVGSEKYAFKLDWMGRLRSFFDRHYDKGSPVLLCGDFNVAPEERDVHDVRLWQGRILFSEPERTALQVIKDWGFTDAFRLHTEAGGNYSWWDYRAGMFRRNMGLRIDHIWISQPLVTKNTQTWIDMDPRTWEKPSDHAPVVAEFEW